MRRIAATFVALVVVTAGGCLTIGPSSSSSGGSTSSTTTTTTTTSTATGGGCNSQPSCDECTVCAAQGTCSDAEQTCGNDSSCVGLDECMTSCGMTSDCLTMCEDDNQPGIDDYVALRTCIYCTSCPSACAGFASCSG